MKTLCIFDLDGTLVDTLPDLTASLNVALNENGFPMLTPAQTAALVGHSVVYMCQNAVPPDRFDAWERVYARFMAHYSEHLTDSSRPYAQIPPLLSALRQAGATLAVVTNKPHPHAVRMIRRLFPDAPFSLVLGRMDRFAIKPAPDALRFAIDLFCAPDGAVAYIGDSEVDVAFAKNAGVPCFSVDWGLRTAEQLRAAGASVIVSRPDALLPLLTQ